MSYAELLEITESPLMAISDPVGIRDKIFEEFKAAKTSEERAALLALFKATFDITEAHVAKNKPEALAGLQKARAYDYKLFIYTECTVGLDTPIVGGDVSVDMLINVTDREIAAGRMTEDHSIRKIAIEGASMPHLSHDELLAKHAKLKDEAAKSSLAGKLSLAESGKPRAALEARSFGQKLRGLFGG